jgi:hypothetical protein
MASFKSFCPAQRSDISHSLLRSAGVDAFVLLFLEGLGARKLELFFSSLVAIMTLSMGWMYAHANCPTTEVVLGALIPRLRWASCSFTCIVWSLYKCLDVLEHRSSLPVLPHVLQHSGTLGLPREVWFGSGSCSFFVVWQNQVSLPKTPDGSNINPSFTS